MKARGTYTVSKWEESTYQDISPEMKLCRATVVFDISGEIKGTASVEYLLFYQFFDPKDPHAAIASYVSLIRFEGVVGGKEGGFVMRDEGSYQGGRASSRLRIEEGSGTGALHGIAGTGMYRADDKGYTIELEYQLD